MTHGGPPHPSNALLIAAVASGCVSPPRDISDDPRVRALALVGRCLVVREDTPIVRLGKPYPRRALVEHAVQPKQGGPGQSEGTVAAGTRLIVIRVERATVYNDGLFQIHNDIAFGRIESGPHTGKTVDLGWRSTLPERGRRPVPYDDCPVTPSDTP